MHNFARKHASYGRNGFFLSLFLSRLDTREERLKLFLDWISDRAQVLRFSEERVPSSVINILTVVRGKVGAFVSRYDRDEALKNSCKELAPPPENIIR